MEGSLYDQMLQQQSWLNMLDDDSQGEQEAAANEDARETSSGERGRTARPGWRCGSGASAGTGFGAGGGFGPFQMFVGASPFGMPPHSGPTPGLPPHGHGYGPGRHGRHHGGPPGVCPFRPHGHGGPPGPPPPFGPPHGPPSPVGPCPPHGRDEVPRVDVLKEAHQFTLIADLPGFSKKDVDIKIADNKLTIRGKLPEKGAAAAAEEEVIGERHPFSSFDRTFRLWSDIETDKITAKLEHGVLRVILARTVPKSQEIPVESSDDEYVAVDEGDDANAGPSNA